MTENIQTTEPAITSKLDITYLRVLIVNVVAMSFIMGIDVVSDQKISEFSAVGLVVLAFITSLLVRRGDFLAAVWSPAIAWLFAVLTVGQLALKDSGSFRIKEAAHIVNSLADFAYWILGATAVAIVVTFVRRFLRP